MSDEKEYAEKGRDVAFVRWLSPDRIDAGDWPDLERLLDAGERARARRFHFERDRKVYVAAHALVRGLLFRQTGIPAAAWRFTAGPHGKPEAVCPPDAPRLRVNLSHTRGLAAAALTVAHDVGIDAEWLAREPSAEKLAARYFAPSERDAVAAAAPAARKTATFLAFWTLKEAYIKAIGKGLAQPLESFAFTLDPLGISFAPGAGDDPARWLFCRFVPTPAHVMALAVRHPEPARLAVDAAPADLADLLLLARDGAAGPGRISRR